MSLLAGKTGLIVGIANERSYAWHIAKSLHAHGARCAFTHLPGERNEFRCRRAIAEIGIADPWVASMDAAKDEDIDAVFAKYAESFDRMDFLIHSIAYAEREFLRIGSFLSTTRAAYLQAIDISSYTLLALAARARPMMARTGGSILGMSYYGAEKVIPGYNVMGVAKAALEATGRYMANELGPDKIRVNLISGGYLRTLASSAVGGADDVAKLVEEKSPLRRNVDGAEVGDAAVWLVSDLSRAVTGETLYVDCGVNIIGG
ncbi:MAG: enoyl-ACP reductase FabI [Phycisphaerales bacterium]